MAERQSGRGTGRTSRRGLSAAWVSLALFWTVLAVLVVQLTSGDDPGLRMRRAAAPAPVRRVLVRRIEIRSIVHHLPPNEPTRPTSATSQSGPVAGFSSPMVTRAS